MHPIIKEIFQGGSVTKEESQIIFDKLKRREIKRGERLLQVGDLVDEIFYTHEGCLRNFIIDSEGKEHTIQFAVHGWWISDYIALYGRQDKTATSYIECIKDAVIYSISKREFAKICQDFPNVALFHIRKMELAFASFQNRILENLTLTARQRYINFVQTYPMITQDVKNYHIASYLGITTESLSRIRKEIASA